MAITRETELYAPIKAYLENLGYSVRGEVKHCDIVAMREGDHEPVIIELKKTFNLALIMQGIDRTKQSNQVYLAFEKAPSGRAPQQLKWSDLTKLCRMLGLGLMTVRFYKRKKPLVEVHCEPEAYVPRKSPKRTANLIREFTSRSGDYNVGGSTRQKIVTAYREQALQLARMLRDHGPLSPAKLKLLTGNAKAASMLQKNYYRWYTRVSRGIYEITPAGVQALNAYAFIDNNEPTANQSPTE